MQLLDSQQVTLSVAGKDKAGNPADLSGGTLTWTVSDESVAALTDNGDGTALVVAGSLGSVVVTVDFTGADGADFKGSLAVDVVGGPVTEVDVVAEAPVDKA